MKKKNSAKGKGKGNEGIPGFFCHDATQCKQRA